MGVRGEHFWAMTVRSQLGTQSVNVKKRSQDGTQANEYDCEVFVESGKQTGFVIEGQTAAESNKSHPAMSATKQLLSLTVVFGSGTKPSECRVTIGFTTPLSNPPKKLPCPHKDKVKWEQFNMPWSSSWLTQQSLKLKGKLEDHLFSWSLYDTAHHYLWPECVMYWPGQCLALPTLAYVLSFSDSPFVFLPSSTCFILRHLKNNTKLITGL